MCSRTKLKDIYTTKNPEPTKVKFVWHPIKKKKITWHAKKENIIHNKEREKTDQQKMKHDFYNW